MKPFTPPSGGIQEIPVTVMRETPPDMAWRTHKALMLALAADPKLSDDPLWGHFLKVAYARFETSLGVAQ